jgi:shikimate dehydrogenase
MERRIDPRTHTLYGAYAAEGNNNEWAATKERWSRRAPSQGRRYVSERTKLAGLIGDDIQGSSAPAMHEHEARALGIALTYRAIDFARPKRDPHFLAAMLDAAESLAFSGLNITHPYKQAVIPLLHDLSNDARRIGAVNTVVFSAGKRLGHNTDWSGFADNFTAILPDAELSRVALIGAGGAGSAVGYAALMLGTRTLILYDRDRDRARMLAANLRNIFPDRTIRVAENAGDALHGADGVIQATPVGMLGHPGMSVPADALRPEMWVAEIVYFPAETELVQAARQRGCRVITGGGMAVRQAAASFALFFNVQPNVDRMLRDFAVARKEVGDG